jgi:hypothetical protein
MNIIKTNILIRQFDLVLNQLDIVRWDEQSLWNVSRQESDYRRLIAKAWPWYQIQPFLLQVKVEEVKHRIWFKFYFGWPYGFVIDRFVWKMKLRKQIAMLKIYKKLSGLG